jgi:hypothetical protein
MLDVQSVLSSKFSLFDIKRSFVDTRSNGINATYDQLLNNLALMRVDPAVSRGLSVQVADLPGTYLGLATRNEERIDAAAAGHGWRLDTSSTPNLLGGLESMDLQKRCSGRLSSDNKYPAPDPLISSREVTA